MQSGFLTTIGFTSDLEVKSELEDKFRTRKI